MRWIKPELKVISLNMEVTAYVNPDEQVELERVPVGTEVAAQPLPALTCTLKSG